MGKRILILLVLGVGALALCGATETGAPIFVRANAQRTGEYDAARKGLPPALKWKFRAEGEYLSPPVVAHDMVYFGDEINMYAVNRANGKLRWKYTVSGAGAATVLNNLVYFGGGGNALYALNAFIGTVEWKILSGTVRPGPAALSDNVLYFGGGSFRGGSGGGYLAAVNARTGEERWLFKTVSCVSMPALFEGTLYFGYGNCDVLLAGGQVFAVDARDGTERWHTGRIASVSGPPVVTATALYVGLDQGGLIALSRATGQEIWRVRTAGSVHSPAIANGIVYFGTSEDRAGTFYAVEAATGRVLWQYYSNGWIQTAPAIAGGVVYIATHDAVLHAFDAGTGRELWHYQAERKYPSGVSLAGNTIYWTSGGTLYALE